MNEQENQPNDQAEAAPTVIADLEAIDAAEIKGGPLTVAGEPLILNGSGFAPRTPPK